MPSKLLMLAALSFSPEAASKTEVHLYGAFIRLDHGFSPLNGKWDEAGLDSRYGWAVTQSPPRPQMALWRALKQGGLSELLSITERTRAFSLWINHTGIACPTEESITLIDTSREQFSGRADSWGLGCSVLNGDTDIISTTDLVWKLRGFLTSWDTQQEDANEF